MRTFLILFFCAALPVLSRANQEDTEDKSRSSVYGAFSRGEALTWDQLEVVAKDAGMSGSQLQELKIRDRVLRLIQRFQLPLQLVGFAADVPADEEFRVHKGSPSALGAIELGSTFWEHHAALGDSDAYLAYVLFRAQAYYAYRSHYDAEHCTWIVREESEPLETSFSVLRSALNDSADQGEIQTPPTDRDLEFRRTLDPTRDPVRTITKLIEFALRCIAQKAADNWALLTYRNRIGEPPLIIRDRVSARERALASDFGRARFAMTLAERITFHRVLKTPFRYADTQR